MCDATICKPVGEFIKESTDGLALCFPFHSILNYFHTNT
jgi:hypothetical protein